jgi:UDPglucose 6-dehydrogenase
VIVAVGTHDGNGGWQTKTINDCLVSVVPHLSRDAALVVRSTLPPEFLPQLASIVGRIRDEGKQSHIPVLVNPEFTREGQAVTDFMRPDRVVIGVADDPTGRGVKLLQRMYRQTPGPVLVMHGLDAVLAKLGSNLFLATRISFANELAGLCDLYGADVEQVVAAMAYDQRIGGSFFRAGIGFGGSCLPHQVTMTIRGAAASGGFTPLMAAVEEINRGQRSRFVDRIESLLGGSLSDARIALLGLTFKPETDDLRDAPSLEIARLLLERGASVVAYDPMAGAMARAEQLVPGLVTVSSALEALEDADAAGLVTEWSEFLAMDWASAARRMRRPILVDGRNALPPLAMLEAGLAYSSFGRGTLIPGEGETRQTPLERLARQTLGLFDQPAATVR